MKNVSKETLLTSLIALRADHMRQEIIIRSAGSPGVKRGEITTAIVAQERVDEAIKEIEGSLGLRN